MTRVVGMVLCGGLGRRLRPITDSIPKSLIELKEGYTILDKQILDLKYAGVDHVILLTGYLHERIEERYGKEWNGVRVDYSVDEEPVGTWGAVANALETFHPNGRLIISNGDIVSDVNFRRMLSSIVHPVTMFIVNMRSPYGIVDITGDRISRFREKPYIPYYINGGVYVVREGFDLLEFTGEVKFPSDLEKDVFPKLAQAGLLGYYMEPYNVFWKAIDTVKDLDEVRREFANREDKAWGYEKLIESTESYVYRKILVKEGYRIPLHRHNHREETIYVAEGKVKLEVDGREFHLEPGDKYTVQPEAAHAVSAIETAFLDCVSAPNPDDVEWLDQKWLSEA